MNLKFLSRADILCFFLMPVVDSGSNLWFGLSSSCLLNRSEASKTGGSDMVFLCSYWIQASEQNAKPHRRADSAIWYNKLGIHRHASIYMVNTEVKRDGQMKTPKSEKHQRLLPSGKYQLDRGFIQYRSHRNLKERPSHLILQDKCRLK